MATGPNKKEERKAVYANGLFARLSPRAPEWVICNLSIRAEDFRQFLQENVNSEGWVSVDIKRSQSTGKLYAELNTWKPGDSNTKPYQKPKPAEDPVKASSSHQNYDDDIPF